MVNDVENALKAVSFG